MCAEVLTYFYRLYFEIERKINRKEITNPVTLKKKINEIFIIFYYAGAIFKFWFSFFTQNAV